MLRVPTKGLQPSVNKHNCRVDVLADWIEGSVLLNQTRISKSDIVDRLIEEEVYRSEDFARELIADIWSDLRYRVAHGRIRALRIDSDGVIPRGHWSEFPAYSFCLTLALRDWCSFVDNSHREQGDLFERLTECSMGARGWRTRITGWPTTNASNVRELVEEVASHIKEPVAGNIEEWIEEDGKDGGLDLVCDKPFADDRGGHPLYFFQCASGRNWKSKIKTPDLEYWEDLIDFVFTPTRGLAIPYVLSTKREFRRIANRVDGILLDRLRLMAPFDRVGSQVPPKLGSDLNKWLTPRIEALKLE